MKLLSHIHLYINTPSIFVRFFVLSFVSNLVPSVFFYFYFFFRCIYPLGRYMSFFVFIQSTNQHPPVFFFFSLMLWRVKRFLTLQKKLLARLTINRQLHFVTFYSRAFTSFSYQLCIFFFLLIFFEFALFTCMATKEEGKKHAEKSRFMWIDAKRVTDEKKYVIGKDTCTFERLRGE